MAIFTSINEREAEKLTELHGLGRFVGLVAIPAGSVNTNYFLDTERGRFFLRLYEEQGREGVLYEWALLEVLCNAKLSVPRRIAANHTDVPMLHDKPIGMFEVLGGEEICQRLVTLAHARNMGAFLGNAHHAAQAFKERRAGRFNLASIQERMKRVSLTTSPELESIVQTIQEQLAELQKHPAATHVDGVIHGDLFRDNVRWQGDRIVGVLDWESASDGAYGYDLMVMMLAWCFDDDFRWELVKAMLNGYQEVRALQENERQWLRTWAKIAAVRFTVTRITDFYLRKSIGDRVMKDYRRFEQRLRVLCELTDEEFLLRAGVWRLTCAL